MIATSAPVALCPCGFTTKLDPRSAAYQRAHRANHIEVYPRLDAFSLANLDRLVEIYEQREAVAEVRS